MKIGKSLVLFLLIMIFTGCSSMNKSADMTAESQLYGYDESTLVPQRQLTLNNANSAPMATPAPAADFEKADRDYNTSIEGGAYDTGEAAAGLTPEVERKIIKTAGLSIETYNYDTSAQTLTDTVLKFGGYVESANTWLQYFKDNESLKRGDFTVRVPQEYFETAKAELETIGKVIGSSMGGDDVTTQYYDIESRLSIKKEEEKRVFEMIAQADKIEDLIKLEERLSLIRTDIEVYQTRLNSIDRLSSFSTITINLTEVREKDRIVYEDDFLGRLKSSFVASVNFVISAFQWIVLFVTAAFLPCLIIGAIVFVVWKFISKKK